MTRQEPTLFEALQTWNQIIKKIIKALNKNKIPNDYQGMKNMIAEMEADDKKRNEMNRMREKIKHMIRERKLRARWVKLERRRKIRKLLHLPYKTLNEDEFFKQIDSEPFNEEN